MIHSCSIPDATAESIGCGDNGSGNVGVGLDSPLTKLHVFSQSTADYSVSCDPGAEEEGEGTGLVRYDATESSSIVACQCDVNINANDA